MGHFRDVVRELTQCADLLLPNLEYSSPRPANGYMETEDCYCDAAILMWFMPIINLVLKTARRDKPKKTKNSSIDTVLA